MRITAPRPGLAIVELDTRRRRGAPTPRAGRVRGDRRGGAWELGALGGGADVRWIEVAHGPIGTCARHFALVRGGRARVSSSFSRTASACAQHSHLARQLR